MTNEEIARFFNDTQAYIQGNPDLRDPQVEGWFRTRQHFRNSSEHAILQIPVGCGKTGLMALLPFGIAQGRVLVIAPNLEIRRGISTAFDIAGRDCFWTITPNMFLTGEIREAINEVIDLCIINTAMDETDSLFTIPPILKRQYRRLNDAIEALRSNQAEMHDKLRRRVRQLESYVCGKYGIDRMEIDDVDEWFCRYSENDVGETIAIVSYALGVIAGRWDIYFATGERQPPKLPDPFDPLPVCPPGMLQGPEGLPAKPEDVTSNYPIRIDWDVILVDDPGHEDDIIRRARDVLEVIWKDRAEAIEREACDILGVRELRDYFRKPGNGGFWMDHVKRYSKSRRKAPIYWYLRSAKGNYGLWLYYHRLDKDILFKALLNYVEPKIRLEEDRLKSLRFRKEAAGSSGREAKQIEKDMDRQDQLVSELNDFADKLRKTADLHLKPDLNDGVVLNIAPLFELVPWKETKKYWEDLVAGKYEWSSIGRQMRDKGLVKK